MISVLSVFVGGGIGSVMRYVICNLLKSHWAVFGVNILGALFIGAAVEYFAGRADLRPEMRSFVVTGLLGGFTTFSTYMLDFGTLVNDHKIFEGSVYLLGSIAIGAAFLFLGIRLAKICF